jgi:hypothetical protein
VRFEGFGADEDEWVNVKKCIRQRSIPVEASQCKSIVEGDLVLCFRVSGSCAMWLELATLLSNYFCTPFILHPYTFSFLYCDLNLRREMMRHCTLTLMFSKFSGSSTILGGADVYSLLNTIMIEARYF